MKLSSRDRTRVVEGFVRGFQRLKTDLEKKAEAPEIADYLYKKIENLELISNLTTLPGAEDYLTTDNHISVAYDDIYMHPKFSSPKVVNRKLHSGFVHINLEDTKFSDNPHFIETLQNFKNIELEIRSFETKMKIYLAQEVTTLKRLNQEFPDALKFIDSGKRAKFYEKNKNKRKVRCNPMPDDLRILLAKARMFE